MTKIENGLIEIRRPLRLLNKWRSYAIYLDGVKVGRIKERETISITVSAGTHTIWLKIDWLRSNPFQLNIVAGRTVVLIAETNRRADWKYGALSMLVCVLMVIGFQLRWSIFIFYIIALVILSYNLNLIYWRPKLREP